MATRTDMFIRWVLSPRIVEVKAPSISLTGQDLVDTVRVLEDRFIGMTYPHILNSSGKESLGGGVFVGITSELQNAQIFFQGQTVLHATGTVTTASGAPVLDSIRLIDSNADFITDAVQRGFVITNMTDANSSTVLDVVSATELLTSVPLAGTDNDFALGDSYLVCSSIGVTVSGGNVLAVDTGASAIEAVIPATFNFVTVEKASGSTIVIPDPFPVDVKSIDGSILAAQLLRCSAETMSTGTITTVTSNQQFNVTFDQGVSDPIAGRLVMFKTGTKVRGVTRIITADASTAAPETILTVVALGTVPTVGDTVVLV